VAEDDRSRAEDGRAERAFQSATVAVDRDLADHHLDHPVQEIVLVSDVRVKRHRSMPSSVPRRRMLTASMPLAVSQADGGLSAPAPG
jgi:hypothetical protein